MNTDLEELKIIPREIEGLTGLEVNDLFIGGLLGGTYRPSIWRQPQKLVSFGFTQLLVAGLLVIFTLPIGLWLIRDSPGAIRDPASISRFLLGTVGVAGMMVVAWNVYMFWQAKSLKPLAHLLEEVDRYNEVLEAMAVLDRLESIGNPTPRTVNREQALEALHFARTSLICGLMTEKILRQNRRLIARRDELFASLETNLTALKALEIKNQGSEYAHLLNQALQIALSVQQEIHQISIEQ